MYYNMVYSRQIHLFYRIVESKNPQFKVGDIVYGRIGWRTAFVSDGKDLTKATHLPADVPESLAIGTLGMPG